MTDREAMKQVLEALNNAEDQLSKPYSTDCIQAADALRAQLEKPEQEPRCAVIVEVFGKDWRLDYMSLPVGKHKLYTQQYIYTTPPQREPLRAITYVCPVCAASLERQE